VSRRIKGGALFLLKRMLLKKGDVFSGRTGTREEAKLPLNIPVDKKRDVKEEESEPAGDIQNLTEWVSQLCLNKEDTLHLKLENLQISDESSDDDSVIENSSAWEGKKKGDSQEETEKKVVSKGPENKKNFQSNKFTPYQTPAKTIPLSFTGYSHPPVTRVGPYVPNAETLVPQYGIGVSPEMVREESKKCDPLIDHFLNLLNEGEKETLFSTINTIQQESTSPVSDQSEIFPPTPESGYETMSPSSPPNRRSEGHTPDYYQPTMTERSHPIRYAPCPPQRFIMPESVIVDDSRMKISAEARLKERGALDQTEKCIEWVKVCREDLLLIDDKGLTKLMKHLQDADNPKLLVNVYVRTLVLKTMNTEQCRKNLMHKNNEGHSALYMAAMHLNHVPIIARLIADTIVFFGANPDEVVDKSENTLLHLLAQQGDSHAEVLAEMLNTLSENSPVPAFKVNRSNIVAQTPLHVAVLNHSPPEKSCIAVIKLLIKYNGDISNQDGELMTPLHIATKSYCDPRIIKALLQARNIKKAINLTDNQRRTALHYAGAFPNAPISRQSEIMKLLKESGASSNIFDLQGKLAINHLDSSRKEVMKQVLNRKVF